MPEENLEKTAIKIMAGILGGLISYANSLDLIHEHNQTLSRALLPYAKKEHAPYALLQEDKEPISQKEGYTS